MFVPNKQSLSLKSPAVIFIAVAVSVFISETLVMLLLNYLPQQAALTEAVLDASLTVLLTAPMLYFFLFRPLVAHIHEWQKTEERLLKNKEEQFKIIVRGSLDGFWITDMAGRFLEVNNAYCQLLGYTQDELLKMSIADIKVTDDPQDISQRINKIIKVGGDRFETQHRCKDGRVLDLMVSANYINTDGGRIYSFLHDITERNLLENTLLENEEKFRSISTYSYDAIIMMDNAGKISYWNPAAEKIFGYSVNEVMGKELHTYIAPAIYYDAFKKAFSQFCLSGKGDKVGKYRELTAMRKGGEEFQVELGLNAVQLNGKWHAVGVIRDITERKQAEEKLHYLAHYDALTGLPNRLLFADRLHQVISAAKRNKTKVALMYLDLDKFKPVNDDLGHDVGDLLLKEVAERMRKCMRESDTVSRIGGDEFVILLPEVNTEQHALLVANNILNSLNKPFELAGHVIHISSSIGVAIYPDHASDENNFIKNADAAMYLAKNSGRDNVQLFKPSVT